MIRQTFNNGWNIIPNESLITLEKPKGEPVTLPYDIMLRQSRSKDAASQGNTGFFPDIVCTLVKHFDVPFEWENQCVLLEFEGVYTNSMVYINGDYAGGCLHGYTNFYVNADHFLKYGEINEIKVLGKTCKDSRWYTGAGIYRNVKLLVSNLIHILPDGYQITTPEVDEKGALVEVVTTLKNSGHKNKKSRIVSTLLDAEGKPVAEGTEIVTMFSGKTETLRQRLYISMPFRWGINNPYLYTAKTKVYSGEQLIDEEVSTFGVRTIALDVQNGFRINGETIKLRGACVHHDNGVIGSAAIERAEERRVELLKQAGFNAVRSAHNPISKAFLNACDKLGLVVMDELSDIWTRKKLTTIIQPFFRTIGNRLLRQWLQRITITLL